LLLHAFLKSADLLLSSLKEKKANLHKNASNLFAISGFNSFDSLKRLSMGRLKRLKFYFNERSRRKYQKVPRKSMPQLFPASSRHHHDHVWKC
jgi:hypothetical protein